MKLMTSKVGMATRTLRIRYCCKLSLHRRGHGGSPRAPHPLPQSEVGSTHHLSIFMSMARTVSHILKLCTRELMMASSTEA